ncbi:MAG: hypothetical protein BGP12_16600 [Rhodospirillales bacterium 70-18]|nr:DUF1499 domain-containing protein [Rhodospirillales bacterium]OJY64144.1 MAG: hypothetical protein BGP12_16600 [Rhodospirillales bacterium 70-18]
MTWLLRMLVALVFPACGLPGAQGLPVPPPMTLPGLHRPDSPNTALAAPAGFTPAPDIVTRAYPVPPATLYTAIRAVAAAAPRSFPQVAYDDRLQAHYVVRSKLLNFPDLVTIQVIPGPVVPGPVVPGQVTPGQGTPGSGLILWSRSVYGRSDFGVNKARLAGWLAALDARLATP